MLTFPGYYLIVKGNAFQFMLYLPELYKLAKLIWRYIWRDICRKMWVKLVLNSGNHRTSTIHSSISTLSEKICWVRYHVDWRLNTIHGNWSMKASNVFFTEIKHNHTTYLLKTSQGYSPLALFRTHLPDPINPVTDYAWNWFLKALVFIQLFPVYTEEILMLDIELPTHVFFINLLDYELHHLASLRSQLQILA